MPLLARRCRRTLGPFATIPAFQIPSSPCNHYFPPLSSALCTLCKTPQSLRFRRSAPLFPATPALSHRLCPARGNPDGGDPENHADGGGQPEGLHPIDSVN